MTRDVCGSKSREETKASDNLRRRFLLDTRAELIRNLQHLGDNPIARASSERLLAEFDRLLAEVPEDGSALGPSDDR